MGLALICVRRGDRFDPLACRALGFTRCAGRKGQFELAICTAEHVLLILSLCGHLPAPDYLPVTYRLGLDPRGHTIARAREASPGASHVLRTTTPSADFPHAVNVPCGTFSSDRHRNAWWISRGKFDCFRRTTAGFTLCVLDGYGLRGHMPARPTLAPQIRFLYISPRLCLALPSDLTSP